MQFMEINPIVLSQYIFHINTLCGTIKVVGAFAELQKAIVTFFMYACVSVCMEQLGSHWMDFYKIYIWGFFEKILVSLKYDKNDGFFT